jgi:hypothetical protein
LSIAKTLSFHVYGEKKIEHQVRTTEGENTQNEKDKGGVLPGSILDSRSRLLGVYRHGSPVPSSLEID